jgi:hypothetical protein
VQVYQKGFVGEVHGFLKPSCIDFLRALFSRACLWFSWHSFLFLHNQVIDIHTNTVSLQKTLFYGCKNVVNSKKNLAIVSPCSEKNPFGEHHDKQEISLDNNQKKNGNSSPMQRNYSNWRAPQWARDYLRCIRYTRSMCISQWSMRWGVIT